MRIRNAAALATTPLRALVLALAEAALEAVDTGAAIRRAVGCEGEVLLVQDRPHPLPAGRVLLVGVGKCAAAAATALAGVPGLRLDAGIVLDVVEVPESRRVPALSYHAGTHPLPSAGNVVAAGEIVAMLESAGAGDLVLAVVSGGGSTLLCLPPPGLSWEREQMLFRELTRAGATIRELNTVRKHTSFARGGFLARAAHPAPLVSLIFNDVPGAAVEFVASGPTVRDSTTVEQAREVLERYGLAAAVAARALVETPKEPHWFANAAYATLVSNALALEAMAARARGRGLTPRIVDAAFAGEAREVAARVAADLATAPSGTVLLYGGESTVTLRGGGRGGRNAELALAALPLLGEAACVVALASDGRDNGERAGALADAAVRQVAASIGADIAEALTTNNSYGFYERVGGFLDTGATGANVADLVIAVRG